MQKNEKTDVGLWDSNWNKSSTTAIAGESGAAESFVWQRMRGSIGKAFSRVGISSGKNLKLIEIGAGGSEWLGLFYRSFGFSVAGLDYSEVGCRRTREILDRLGIQGDVIHADMFAPPPQLWEQYDVVTSFGLVEHFQDTASAVAACAAFAKPGGLVITTIPNMAGLHGWLYRLFDRKIYDTHVPLTRGDLEKAHKEAKLEVLFAEYLFGLPGVIDGGRVEPNPVRRIIRKVVHAFTKLHWKLEKRKCGFPENPVTSPYILCVARKAG